MSKKIIHSLSARSLLLAACISMPAMSVFAQQPAATAGELSMRAAAITAVATSASMLSVTHAGQRLVAVGDHGVVLLSDDDGKSFRQAKSVPVSVTLTGVSFADQSNGWAVGQWGVILHTTDGGESWQLQRSDTAVDQPLFSVYFKNKTDGVAVGLWSLVLETRDGGASWNVKNLPAPPDGGKADRNLYKIFANEKGDLFVAAEQGIVLRSTDGGDHWSYLKTGNKGSLWSGVALANGSLIVAGLRGAVYRSTDNGDTWVALDSGTKSSVVDLAGRGNNAVAVGLDGTVLEINGDTVKPSQRDDRLPLTAVTQAADGRTVMFSKKGVVDAASVSR